MDKIFLTVDETAEYLGLPKSRIYILISERGFPAHKFGKSWAIHREKLEKWAECKCR